MRLSCDKFMKRILLIIFLVFLFTPNIAYANGAGLPPFFKINGKYSISNPLQMLGITAQSFLIPQDFTPENYMVNEPIDFEIDNSQLLPVIGELNLKNTKYSWDFGDGSKAEGLKNSHTYSMIGSYILVLTINIYDTQVNQPTQFIDSFLLNIVPDKNYRLPKAIIAINGKEVKDPLYNPFSVNYKYPVTFDASRSENNAANIITYLWNFGDGQTSTEKIPTHKYTNQDIQIIVLRVKDKDGFISDAFVGLNNDPNIKNTTPVVKNKSVSTRNYVTYIIIVFIGVGVFLVIAFFIRQIIIKKYIRFRRF